jgi:glycosyltransferase involved in cell wall biosynthesis
MDKLLAIVPAYNEAGAITSTVGDLKRHAPDFDVLVVDDGSTDITAELARDAGARVLQLPFNLGIGGAVQAGYVWAREHGYDVAVQCDGDGQHDARSLNELLRVLRTSPGINMVTGSRFLEADAEGYKSSGTRRLGIRLFGAVLSKVTGRPVTDPTSGLRMCDRHGIELFARDYPHDYPEVEAVLMVHAHDLNATEVPVVMRPRTSGVSSINAGRSMYYMIKVMLALFVGLLRSRPDIKPGAPAPVTAEHGL